MKTIQKGDRIKLISMKNDPNPIKVGMTGTVTNVNTDGSREFHQIHVEWDDGRTLRLLPYEDEFELL